MPRKSFWDVFGRIFGVMVFLMVWAALNLIDPLVESAVFHSLVVFLNDNFFLLILISLFFLAADIFSSIVFPFSLPAPLFNAIGSIFVVTFVIRVLKFIDSLLGAKLFSIFTWLSFVVYPLIFLLVLVIGYLNIFSDAFRPRKRRKRAPSWKEIGEDIRISIRKKLRKR